MYLPLLGALAATERSLVKQPESKVGQTKNVSIIYGVISVALIAAVLTGQNINGQQLSMKSDIWLPVFLLLTAIGVYRKTRWGRWLGYLVSIPFFINVPVGTFLGGYMLWHLTKYRGSFKQWMQQLTNKCWGHKQAGTASQFSPRLCANTIGPNTAR